LDYGQINRRLFVQAAFVFTLLFSAAAPMAAQQGARPMTDKWRPKDGVYASPGANFNDLRLDFAGPVIELGERAVSAEAG
jgi:hypothetical protein